MSKGRCQPARLLRRRQWERPRSGSRRPGECVKWEPGEVDAAPRGAAEAAKRPQREHGDAQVGDDDVADGHNLARLSSPGCAVMKRA